MKYKVKVQHYGDRQYMPGDTREATESDVKHLVESGVLERTRETHKVDGDGDAKSEGAAPKNKAVGAAPENKAGTSKARKAD